MTGISGRPLVTRTLSQADFAVPIDDRYFEDYAVGAVYEYGYATVNADEIVAFAERFDPQAMHVGLVHTRGELLNQDDQPVLSLVAMNLLRSREAS